MSLFLTILLVSFAESLVAFVGGAFAIFNAERMRRIIHFMVSFAIGALLGVALMEIIPEAAEMASLETVMPYVFLGMIIFFVLEKFLFWYHCHGGVCPVHTYTYLILWGDFLHNFIDGVIIALAFMVDIQLGWLTALAVILHEIPQEIGDFSILMHGGFTRAKALLYNFFSALSVVLGAMLAYALGGIFEPFLPIALALIAGNFIYLAATDLMPELHEDTTIKHAIFQIALIMLGALLVIAPEFFLGGH